MEKIFISNNELETAEIAEKFALISRRGDVFALSGTLGAGKSVFARAFIKKLTEAKEVPSPTFTLVQTYFTPNFDIYHYDLYRLENSADIFELGVEESFFEAVNLVEWPEKMGAFAPRDMWNIKIEIFENTRKIIVSVNDEGKKARLENV